MSGFESAPSSNPKKEVIDESRRNFLKAGAVTALGMAGVEAAEAKEQVAFEYSGFKPTAHEEQLIKARIAALVPDAVSVQINLRAPSEYGTRNMSASIIKKNGKHISVTGSAVMSNQTIEILNGLLENLGQEGKR